jgi:hypothetical protein
MCKFKKSLWNEEVIGFVISKCSGGSNFVQCFHRKRTAFVPRIISNLNLLQELSQILGQELKITAKRNWTDWFLEYLIEFFTLIRFISRKEDWFKAILKAVGKEPSWQFLYYWSNRCLRGLRKRRELEGRLFTNIPSMRWEGRTLNPEVWYKPGMYTL